MKKLIVALTIAAFVAALALTLPVSAKAWSNNSTAQVAGLIAVNGATGANTSPQDMANLIVVNGLFSGHSFF